MQNPPLITCYILTYRRFENLFTTIDSVLVQDYPRIEIGIFDDGSDGFPEEEIREYIDRRKGDNIESIVIHRNRQNLGTVKNMNIMLSLTQGEYLLDIPAEDSLASRSACSTIAEAFRETGAEILFSYKSVLDQDGRETGTTPSRHCAKRLQRMDAGQQYRWIACGAPFTGAGMYYTRKIIEQLGGFDEEYRLQEDGPFFLKATREGHRIGFIEKTTYQYRMGTGVTSGKENNPMLVQDVLKLFDKEIMPYIDRFSPFERRCIRYETERIRKPKRMDRSQKIKLILAYPDVVLYRKIFSH